MNKRIQDHQQPSGGTAVCTHIRTCDEFLSDFYDKYDTDFLEGSNFTQRFNFLKPKFQVLHQGLPLKSRKQTEALEIVLKDPILNRQTEHVAIHIV